MAIWPSAPAFGDGSGLEAVSSVSTGGSIPTVVSSHLNSSGPVLNSPEIGISNGAGSASASGSVQFGSISGVVSATGNAGPIANGGFAVFDGIWDDTLTVTSSTLAAGTTVDLLFTMAYNFSTTCSGANGSPFAEAEFETGSQDVPLQFVTASTSDPSCNQKSAGTQTLNVVTFVGATTGVLGFSSLFAAAGEGSSGQADAPVDFFIDSETAGASYTTASGTNYSTPIPTVPEPSTFGLFGLGLLGLIALRRKAVV
jgi:hypothetical protein